ncbi:MAG: hypothetical protein KBT10_04530 [Bacteroidales bacterium]|nr:hypothetical protein [Candidatus Sodaliphilus aphodohippi]
MKAITKLLTTIVLCIVMVHVNADATTPTILSRANQEQMNAWVEATLNTLTLEERIGQLYVMTIDPNLTDENRREIDKWVKECHIGGLLFSGGWLEKQAQVTNYAQSISRIPLLITLDGEWGLGMRLKDSPSFPRALTIGAIRDESLIYRMGQEVARECRRMGIHVNFAPVVDINDIEMGSMLDTRSYGQSPLNISRKAIAFAKGMESGGVVATAKHFPGHGSATGDSHLMLPTVKKTLRQTHDIDLVPFKDFINEGLSGVMVAHLFIPTIEPDTIPGTLSPRMVNGLLKNELGFQGLAITDALQMEGARSKGSVSVQAILAGNNILLCPDSLPNEIKAVKEAIDKGIISQETIAERARQVLRYKFALGVTTPQHVDTENLVAEVYSPQAKSLMTELWENAITMLPGKKEALPLCDSKRVAVVSLCDPAGTESPFQNTCGQLSPTTRYSYMPGDNVDSLVNAIDNGRFDAVVIGIFGKEKQRKLPNQRIIADILASRCKHVIPVFMCNALELKDFSYTLDRCDKAVVAFSNEEQAQVQAARTLFGANQARGIMPMDIGKFYQCPK